MPDHQQLRWFLTFVLVLLVLLAGQTLVSGDDGGGLAALRALRLKLMIMALICCLLPAIVQTASWATDNRPIVVLRIDDCSTSWNTSFTGLGGVSGLSYGKSKHIPITWAVISSLASSVGSLTWAQIKDYLDNAQYTDNGIVYRGEPASHSVTHSSMPSQQDYINEVVNSKAAIQANLPGYQCNTFLQPGTWTGNAYMDCFAKLDNPIGQAIQANYAQSMAYIGAGWRIGNTYYPYGTTNLCSIDPQGLPTIPAINAELDIVAATPGLIYVISGHAVQEQGHTVEYSIAADILKATMDKLADLRDQGKLRLMSLNDAFQATFSPDLNRVPDPGFELCNPGVINVPWATYASAQMVSPGGVDDSRYCSVPDGAASIRSTFLTLPPGRYEMNWYQKVLNGKSNGGLVLAFSTMNQKNQTTMDKQLNCINWAFFYNSSPITNWQKKTALALVGDRLNISGLTFQPGSAGSGYGVDNVSIVSAPIDTAVSPSASAVTPNPGICTISWHTPNDPSVTSVVVRYNCDTHPLTPTSGSFLCTVTSHPNTVQQISVPLDWTYLRPGNFNYAYFSVFGTKANGSFTPPDLAFVMLDKTPPTTPNVVLAINPDNTIHAYWTSSDPDTQVVQYQYAVGLSPGGESIKHWTFTSNTSATVTADPGGAATYVSVKAQNLYGFWSAVGSANKYVPMTISLACALGDGQLVSVSGIVTAVFSDCCYIEHTNRSRAIKIVGNVSSFHQGDQISVSGSMATRSGERCVIMP